MDYTPAHKATTPCPQCGETSNRQYEAVTKQRPHDGYMLIEELITTYFPCKCKVRTAFKD